MIWLNYTIFQRVIIGCIFTGLLTGLLGVFVVKMRLTAIGYSIAHSAFAGAALGLALLADPLMTALLFSIATALLIGPAADKAKLPIDTITSIAFSLNMALAFIFLTLAPTVGLSSEVASVLWGSIVAITNRDLFFLVVLTSIVIALVYLFWKEIFTIMFDRRMAEADGINTKPFIYFTILMVGVVIAFSLRLVGGILVYALLFNPASSALQFSHDMRKIIVLSPILGVISCISGFFLSLVFNVPIGSSIVLISTIMFAISVIISPKKRREVRT
ncbi:MAG: metal ABC transporter permease [Candidatus Bathyarchaeia archaeon]|nr:metal ABC transporter permease [Candidatus Bathyarchaeota archaeon]